MANKSLEIAVQGCCHGELNTVYSSLLAQPLPIDLLIVGGDFQSVRNLSDLKCMSVPAKFRKLGDFADYYSGKRTAPVLTLFVGGNHEASNYLQELFYGGWVAPNIYYLGASNVVRFRGLTIGGISGIWSRGDYVRGHMEKIPYNEKTLRSVYHVRQYEVKKLLAYQRSKIDLFLSHDWPRGVEQHGDTGKLLRAKPFFREEVMRNDLGSPASEELLRTLKPRYWFCAHLHVRFEALIDHSRSGDKRSRAEMTSPARPNGKVVVDGDQPLGINGNPDEIVLDLDQEVINPDEIILDLDEEDQIVRTPEQNPDEIELSVGDFDEQAPRELRDGVESKDKTTPSLAEPVKEQTKESEMTLEEYKLSVIKRNGLDALRESAKGITAPSGNQTQFLALDKCLPRRQFLEILHIPITSSEEPDLDFKSGLEYDSEWLAVTKTFAPFHSSTAFQKRLPDLEADLAQNRSWVFEKVKSLSVPMNFELTAPIQDHTITERSKRKIQTKADRYLLLTDVAILQKNPQTVAFCKMLDIPVV